MNLMKSANSLLYQRIAQNLIDDIGKGVWRVGDQLPSEEQLATRYKVSRFTIRSALNRVQSKGMISRRRRLGTTVQNERPLETMVQEVRTVDELFQYPEGTRLKVLRASNFSTDVSVANFLGCAVGSKWTKIETIRLSQNRSPVCLTEIYVPEAYKSVKDYIGKDSTPAFKLLERHFQVVAQEINAEISAGNITSARSKQLHVEPDSASLILIRRYRNAAGELLEVSTSEHPASRFTYSFNLNYRR